MRRIRFYCFAILLVWCFACGLPNLTGAEWKMNSRAIAVQHDVEKDITVNPSASRATVTLLSDLPSGQEIGKSITWTATADGLGRPVYRLSISHGGLFVIVRDYSEDNTFVWNPIDEGNYKIRVEAKENGSESASCQAEKDYTIKTRLNRSS